MIYQIYNRYGICIGKVDAIDDDNAMKRANDLYPANRPLALECRERNERWRQAEQDAYWQQVGRMSS